MAALTALCAGADVRAAERTETLHREIALAPGVREVVVDNVNGPVHVRAGEAGKVTFTIEQHASARRESSVDDAFREVTLTVENEAERLALVQDGPFRCDHHWRAFRSGGCDWDPDYEMSWEWNVTVPPDVDVAVSTVNGGELSIDGVRGRVRAANVNGRLRLTGLASEVEAVTVNGGVEAEFDRTPTADSSFKTVNGKVELVLPRDAAAELSIDTLHGDLFTDFEIEVLPVKAVAERDGGPNRYRFEHDTSFRIGGGARHSARSSEEAVRLDCSTVNGDVVVRAR